jgi:TonB-linked SusC/RagA family outer membrane protein
MLYIKPPKGNCMRKISKLALALLLVLGSIVADAQVKTISGVIREEQDGFPISGASIRVKGTNTGTVSNEKGEFSLKANAGNLILIVSSVGYEDREVPVVDGKMARFIELQPTVKTMKDVVVIGYGKVDRRKLTGSVGTLKPDLVGSNPVSVDKLLQGRLAGVQVSPANGAPGSASAITIRGVTTLSDAGNTPLIVIDGVPMYGQDRTSNSTNFSASGSAASFTQPITANSYTPRNQFERNPLANLNPDDIESMEVLKDAYATSIYGSRGAAGVILITTKKGALGKPRVNIGIGTSAQQAFNLPSIMTGDEYSIFYTAYFDTLNNRRPTVGWPPANRAFKKGYNTNWLDQILQTGIGYNLSASVSGGTDKTRYFISGGYDKEASYITNNDFQRAQARVNIETALTNNFKVGISSALSSTVNNALNAQRAYYDAVIKAPNIPVYDSLGLYAWRAVYSPANIINGTAPQRDLNPVGTINTGKNQVTDLRAISSVFAEWKLASWLTYRFDFGVDWYNTKAYSREIDKQGTLRGAATESNINNLKTVVNNLLNFNKRFGDHSISGVVGQSFERSTESATTLTASNFMDDRVLSIISASTRSVTNALNQEWTLASFLGRLDYGYKDKYLLGITNRVDGSSRFSANNRYVSFPSVSAGWVLSKEKFLKNTTWINELKLRGSWGLTGTDGGAGYYGSLGQYSYTSTGTTYAGTTIISGTRPANADLKWQQTTNIDFGIDAGFLQNRIRVTAEYYKRTTKNLLVNGGLPGFVGFSTQQQNLGELENKGFEFTITTKNIDKKDFSWISSFNIARNENIITRLDFANKLDASLTAERSGGRFWTEGGSATAFNLMYWGGVDAATGNPRWIGANDTVSLVPFEILYTGTSRDYNSQRRNLGDALPKFFGGFDNRIRYKDFEFSFFFTFASGNTVFNGAKASMYAFSSVDAPNLSRDILNYWKQPGDVTEIPALINKSNTAFTPGGSTSQFNDYTLGRNSSRFLEDGSFIRLKNLTLAYNLGQGLLKKAGIVGGNIKLYVEANNVFLITKYTGIDPEVSAYGSSVLQAGYDEISMPNPRSFRIGFKIGL